MTVVEKILLSEKFARVLLFLVFPLAILLRIRIVVTVRRLKGGQIEQGRFAASRHGRCDRHHRD